MCEMNALFLSMTQRQQTELTKRSDIHVHRKYTRWFKYDRDCLHLFTYKLVPVIFEPPCISKLLPTRCNVSYLFISIDAVHVSGGSSAHHQEHTTVHTASGIVNR